MFIDTGFYADLLCTGKVRHIPKSAVEMYGSMVDQRIVDMTQALTEKVEGLQTEVTGLRQDYA